MGTSPILAKVYKKQANVPLSRHLYRKEHVTTHTCPASRRYYLPIRTSSDTVPDSKENYFCFCYFQEVSPLFNINTRDLSTDVKFPVAYGTVLRKFPPQKYPFRQSKAFVKTTNCTGNMITLLHSNISKQEKCIYI